MSSDAVAEKKIEAPVNAFTAQRENELRAVARRALREWLDTNNAWSALVRRAKREGAPLTLERERELRALEERLNEVAETLEQAQRELNQLWRYERIGAVKGGENK